MIPDPTSIPTPQDDLIQLVLIARLVERGVIVFVIVLVAVVLMLLMRRKIQNIDLALGTPEGTLKTTLSLSMPIFLLLLLVILSYISFTNPVEFSMTQTSSVSSSDSKRFEKNAAVQNRITWVGHSESMNKKFLLIKSINTVMEIRNSLSQDQTPIALQKTTERLSLALSELKDFRYDLIESSFSPQLRAKCLHWISKPDNSDIPKECRDLVNVETRYFK